MTANELRQKYIEFFIKHGHTQIPSAPLVPENDPTTLFTSSGMQPLIPYLLGQKHPQGRRLVNSQPSFRTEDIQEVGDNRHTTFFEMLGNWSLGDYFKKDQLPWFWEFLTKELGLPKEKLYVSVFEGNDSVPKDTESYEIWKNLGLPEDHILFYGVEKNWWSRSGPPDKMPTGEIGGPDSEVFYELTSVAHDKKFGEKCHPNCNCGRFLEIGNSVFIQYQKADDGSLKELLQKNVDFGGGLERMLLVTNYEQGLIKDNDIFKTDLFGPIIEHIEKVTGWSYQDSNYTASIRIVADHIKASVFLAYAGVIPANKLQGYILRRLIRRATVKTYTKDKHINNQNFEAIAESVMDLYGKYFFLDEEQRKKVLIEIGSEVLRFLNNLGMGFRELERDKSLAPNIEKDLTKAQQIISMNLEPLKIDFNELNKRIGSYTSLPSVASGTVAFNLQSSYGLPPEVSKDVISNEWVKNLNETDWEKTINAMNQLHQEQSRAASAGMFKGGLAHHSETTTKYHTATHLLHQALRTVLGNHVAQKGSNITESRLRFDFSHPEKLTQDQIRSVEDLVNQKIQESLPVKVETMSKSQALKSGALAFFAEKYGATVTVYAIGSFSKEICGGPHVKNTSELGRFEIMKEESAGSGIRRIYAKLS